MKKTTRVLISLIFTLGLWFPGNWAVGEEADPYDLSGTWKLVIHDAQRSFCDCAVRSEKTTLEMEIVQVCNHLTIMLRDNLDDQVLEGRTADSFIGAWDHNDNHVTVLSGRVSQDGKRVRGYMTFCDGRDRQGADTGTAEFVAERVSANQSRKNCAATGSKSPPIVTSSR
jgi:hypothetical protein